MTPEGKEAKAAATLRSGELAARCGVSTDTLRFYERQGLLPRPPRGANGYRRYPAAAERRVRIIQRALDAGFTLAELRRVLLERDRGGAPCRDVHAIAAQRLAELDTRIGDLMRLRDRLAAVVAEWTDRLRTLAPGQRAGLLERLADDVDDGDGVDLDRRTRESGVRQSFTRNAIGYPMANADRTRRPTRRRKR